MRTSFFRMAPKLAPAAFFNSLKANSYTNFYGVPDSLLKDFCAYVTENAAPQDHVITANEGNAVGMAAGYNLATGNVPVVYLQNSGIGNTVNPLLSLTHEQVYKIPMLMLVGWRGDPTGKKDEPQHVAQGRLMKECLESAEVPFGVLEAGPNVEKDAEALLAEASAHFAAKGTPYAILIKRDTFESYKMKAKESGENAVQPAMGREEAIDAILGSLGEKDIVVSTTGMPSREVFEIRARKGAGHHRDFLTVGCMGHASSIAAGIALARPDRTVVCLDGDGSTIMHMGAMAVNGGIGAVHGVPAEKAATPTPLLNNLKHIVVNNGAHDSVGGQPTAGFDVSITGVAKSCGYNAVLEEPAIDCNGLLPAVKALREAKGPAFLEVLVKKGNRADLGRPTTTPQQNKEAFMKFVQEE